MTPTLPKSPPLNSWEPTALGLFVFLILLISSLQLPLVWDEPNAILRSEKLQAWTSSWLIRSADAPPPWTAEGIQRGCPYTTQIEGHPTGYGFLIALGNSLSNRILPVKESFRVGPMLLFALACAAMYVRLCTSSDRATALSSVAFLLLMPRVFAHAHFASTDSPLMSAWIILWATFDWAIVSWKRVACWGVWLGFVMSCKFTGWIAIAPFLGWSIIRRDGSSLQKLLLAAYIGFWVFVLINPALWHDLPNGLQRFFELALSRRELGPNVPTMFLGRIHDMNRPLPWYNTILWILFTVPPITLLFALAGIVNQWRQPNAPSGLMLVVLNWIVLVVVRALPWAPPHDAVRLWLPSFPFLAVLAGMGFSRMLNSLKLGTPFRQLSLSWSASVFVFGWGVLNLALCGPQCLSYYSPVVGGTAGANALGLEPTYYWDSFDQDARNWLDNHSQPGEQVYCHVSPEFCEFWNRTYTRSYQMQCHSPERCQWILVQNRPGLLSSVEQRLISDFSPAYDNEFSGGTFDCLSGRGRVPVLWIFSREQYLSAKLRALE